MEAILQAILEDNEYYNQEGLSIEELQAEEEALEDSMEEFFKLQAMLEEK